MYKFKLPNQKTGYKGKSYTDENLNKLPKDLLKRLERSGIVIEEKKEEEKNKKPSTK